MDRRAGRAARAGSAGIFAATLLCLQLLGPQETETAPLPHILSHRNIVHPLAHGERHAPILLCGLRGLLQIMTLHGLMDHVSVAALEVQPGPPRPPHPLRPPTLLPFFLLVPFLPMCHVSCVK